MYRKFANIIRVLQRLTLNEMDFFFFGLYAVRLLIITKTINFVKNTVCFVTCLDIFIAYERGENVIDTCF